MDIKDNLLKLGCKDVVIGKNYIAVSIKTNFFKINPERIIGIFDYAEEVGYTLITEICIDGNKFVFKKVK